MANKTPVKAIYTGADTTALGEFAATDTVGVAHGGTGLSTVPAGALLYASALDTIAARAIGAAGTVLKSDGAAPAWGSLAVDDLSDVVVTTPAEGHVLTWDATNSRWRNEAQTGGVDTAANYTWTGAHVHAGPAVTVDGGVSNSADITLRGFYDSDATAAVASTKRDFTWRNIVTSGSAYRAALLNDAGAEVFSVDQAGNVVAAEIRRGTADGADNSSVAVAGGGAASSARGAHVTAWGNEHATYPGLLWLVAGDVAGNGSIQFNTGAADRLTINRAGNFGFNTSDIEAWAGAYRAIEGPRNSLMFHGSADAIFVNGNAYFNGTDWYRKAEGTASTYSQSGGTHQLRVAASGAIDTAIVWNIALQIANDAQATFSGSLASYALTVETTGGNAFVRLKNANRAFQLSSGGNGDGFYLYDETAGATRLFVNSGGNLGIGTTDIEAWASTQRVLEFYGASVMASAAGSDLVANSNAYLDGAGYKYKRSGVAARHYLSDGTFVVQVAASGTADTAITWTTALQIVNAGDVQTRALVPLSDNAFNLGASAQRWSVVWAVNGTIQTSTGAEKELGAEVTAAEALEAIRATPVRRFTYAADPGYDYTITKRGKQVKGKRKHRHVGVVLEDLPDWMRTTDTGLNPMSLAGLALAGVRAVDEELTALRARVAALEAA